MKLALSAAVAALLLAACGGAETPAPAAETPIVETPAVEAAPAAAPAALDGPVAGLWKITVTTSGMTLPAQERCYPKQVSLAEAEAIQAEAGLTCSENTYAPAAGGGYTGRSVCTANGMTITSDMTVQGDFNTAYTMDITAKMSPVPPGAPETITTSTRMERVGDCTQ